MNFVDDESAQEIAKGAAMRKIDRLAMGGHVLELIELVEYATVSLYGAIQAEEERKAGNE